MKKVFIKYCIPAFIGLAIIFGRTTISTPATIPVPINARALWYGTIGNIPANWSRDTDYDDRFLQGHGTLPLLGSGGVTHTHTADPHLHIVGPHCHPHWDLLASKNTSSYTSGPIRPIAADKHTHTVPDSDDATIEYTTKTAIVLVAESRPPYTTAIIIKPDDGLQDLPVGVGGFADSGIVTANSDWEISDGGGTTEDLDDRFILGADTDDDGGDTGGTLTHAHAIVAHSHIEVTHTHTPPKVANATPTTTVAIGAGANLLGVDHHDYTYSTVIGTNQTKAANLLAASSVSAYTYLLGVQNEGGGASTPEGIILGYTSLTPGDGWSVCDGTNGTLDLTSTQIRCTVSPSKIGHTGGSNTHIHDSDAHNHTENGHTHNPSLRTDRGTSRAAGPSTPCANDAHTHTVGSLPLWTAPIVNSSVIVTDAKDGRYTFRHMIFIKKDFTEPTVHIKGADILGGVLIAGFLSLGGGFIKL